MLGNFTYCNPTKLYFGPDSLSKLNDELAHYGKNVLLVYGGGSIKTNGIYEKVIAILSLAQKNVIKLSGVMPNPTNTKLREGVALAKGKGIDLILAVGGGSVVDYAKALSVSIHCGE